MGKGDQILLLAATGFGLGRSPKAPGTIGTLAGLPLIWVQAWLRDRGPAGADMFFLISLVLAAVFIADRAEALLGQKDPGCIVIDEMAGYCVAMSLMPMSFAALAAGFAAFRCFDIIKPGPVRWFEKRFTGGAGVVLDDIMAGVLAALLLKIVSLTGLF